MADWRSEMRTAPYLFHLEVSGGARVFHLVQQVLLDARVLMTLYISFPIFPPGPTHTCWRHVFRPDRDRGTRSGLRQRATLERCRSRS